jgi:hypothetical protein
VADAPADPADEARLLAMCDAEYDWDIDTFIALTRRVLPAVVAERDSLAVRLPTLQGKYRAVGIERDELAAQLAAARTRLAALREIVDQAARDWDELDGSDPAISRDMRIAAGLVIPASPATPAQP